MDNLNRYRICTEKADWRGICDINGVGFDSLGTDKEFEALPSYLEPDEVVFAVASGIMKQTITSNYFDAGPNTWLVVLTSERFLFLDAALLTSSIDSQSVRLDKVQAISASQGLLLGKIAIDLGSRLITVDNCNKDAVKVMADLANKWLKDLENGAKVPKDSPEMKEFKKKMSKTDEMASSVSELPSVNRTAAAIIATLLGGFGVHDYIWGAWWLGVPKALLTSITFFLDSSESFVLSAFLSLIVAVWVFVDLVRIFNGKYFVDKSLLRLRMDCEDFYC